MTEETQHTVSSLTNEIEASKARLEKYESNLPINVLQIMVQIITRSQKAGLFDVSEFDTVAQLVSILNERIEQYKTFVTTTESRVQELTSKLQIARRDEHQAELLSKDELISDERRLRKSLEEKIALLESELAKKTPKTSSPKPQVQTTIPTPTAKNFSTQWDDETNTPIQLVVPNEDELNKMTKSEIQHQANLLRIHVDESLTKKEMVSSFLINSKKMIESLMTGK